VKTLTLLLLLAAPDKNEKLIDATTLVKDLALDFKYATEDNFLHKKVYPSDAKCLLRETAAKKLAVAAEALRAKGYRFKAYDCYRPRSVQYEMWKIFPKPGYVADPKYGSNHNRGAAVDITLVTLDGKDVEMPTPFDTFSEAAHHGYSGGTEASRKNRETLREAMEAAGFKKNAMEWWHYDLPETRQYPVLDEPFSSVNPRSTP
jgi:zinc D-Ala-D-Ala dipeptidase